LPSSFNDITRILIPTDGSECGLRAAEYGISIAKTLGAQITVVYVIDAVIFDEAHASFKAGEREDIVQKLEQTGQEYVNYVLGLAKREGVKADSIIAKGSPYQQIVDLANASNVDLIVMGTHGRRGPDRSLIGSVAERVIEYSRCPVLVVK
jgi:nucleotide-binding universal stress UspA family protein